jgi:hypothetical protein
MTSFFLPNIPASNKGDLRLPTCEMDFFGGTPVFLDIQVAKAFAGDSGSHFFPLEVPAFVQGGR